MAHGATLAKAIKPYANMPRHLQQFLRSLPRAHPDRRPPSFFAEREARDHDLLVDDLVNRLARFHLS